MRSRSVLLIVALLVIALLALIARRAALHGSVPAPGAQTVAPEQREDARLESETDRAARADAPRTPAEGTPEAAPAHDARIEGLVVRPDGKPAALARVRYLQDRFEDSTVTDEQGKFTIVPAPVGHVSLVALHDEF